MRTFLTILVIVLAFLSFYAADARTNCDLQPKPALDCPPGYSVMCIPVGGDHWGCGKEANGQIIELVPLADTETNTVDQQPVSQTDPATQQQEQQQPSPSTPAPISDTSDSTVVPSEQTSAPAQDSVSDSQEAVGSSFQNDNRGADPTNLGARNILFLFLVVFASGGILAWFAWWEWMKRRKMTGPKAESDGSEGKICPTCGGSGKIKEKVRKSAPCDHCKKTGRDICHYCSGTGRYGVGLVVPETEDDIQNFMKCDYCEGSGFKNPPLPCCFCKGERKIWYDEWYEKTCPKCKGTGRV